MTFLSRVMTVEEWEKAHEGHVIKDYAEEIDIKRMFWKWCLQCNVKHLWKMETICEMRKPEDES